MNSWTCILLAIILVAGADSKRGRRWRQETECLDANEHIPKEDLGQVPGSEGRWGENEDGELALYCHSGCCRERRSRSEVCCDDLEDSSEQDSDGSRERHGHSHERHGSSGESNESGDEDHFHGHKKTVITLAIVAAVLAVLMSALLVTVCILKKKARKNSRVQSRFDVPYMDGMEEKKQPLPADDSTPNTFMEPYIIKGVAPPAYAIHLDDSRTGPAPDAPPSYSTLSLHEAAREPRMPVGVVTVTPVPPTSTKKESESV